MTKGSRLRFLSTLLFTFSTRLRSASSSPSTFEDSPCSTPLDLAKRVARAFSPDGRPTTHLDTLRGTVDGVLTPSEIEFLLNSIPKANFLPGSGYNNKQYGREVAPHPNLAGLELRQLASPDTGFETKEQYERFLSIREKVRMKTEQALGLCPGTLSIDFTHLVQKTLGGKHAPHADMCFHKFETVMAATEVGRANGNDDLGDSPMVMARCDESRKHPFSYRDAASIVYINGAESFGGGEFYWADQATGQPSILVPPRPGRMAYFTAGPENLHGALPVKNLSTCEGDSFDSCPNLSATATTEPCRVYLAMWYVAGDGPEEVVPPFREFGSADSDDEAGDPSRPKVVLEIPVESIKVGGLRVALSFFLLGLQNEPAKGSWKFVQEDEAPLGMIYKDQSGMFSIRLGENVVAIDRHTDFARRPSLAYQLQESLACHKILDELEKLAFDGEEINAEGRLITFLEKNSIDAARKALPARAD